MQDKHDFTVKAEWDAEARVWYVADSDVPGLVAEADPVEALITKLDELVPELLTLNAHLLDEPPRGRVPVNLVAHREMAVDARWMARRGASGSCACSTAGAAGSCWREVEVWIDARLTET